MRRERRRTGMARIAGSVVVSVLLAGCPAQMAVDAPRPDMIGCDQAAEFAFVGETSLAALGLDEFGGPESGRIGMIWVTADRVSMEPPGARPANAGPEMLSRVVCVQWPDGSGMAGPIDDRWQAPAAPAATGGVGIPAGVLAVVGGLVLLVAASFLAFRRETP